MTGKLDDQELDTLERRFQALRDLVGAMPKACPAELEPTLQELSQAIAALRTDRQAGARPETASLGCEIILQHLFSAIPDLLTVHDRDFNTLMSNWHGYETVPETERRGRPKCYRVYHHRDHPCDHCHAFEVMATGKPLRLPKVNTADGRVREVSAYPILDESGQVALVMEHVRDVTDRHLAEQALKESEGRFRMLFDYAPDAYFLMDLQGNFLDVNRKTEEISGYDRQELIGKNFQFLPLLKNGQNQDMAELLKRAEPGKIIGPVEYCLTRKDGGQVVMEAKGLPLQIKGENLLLVISRDITVRKQIEEARRESEATLRALIESNPESLFLLDTRGVVLAASKVAAQRVGKSLEEVIGADAFSLVPPEVGQRRSEIFKQVVATGQMRRFEDVRGDLHLDISMTPIFGRDKVIQVAVLGVDVTARRQTEEALRESEARFRAVFEFAPAGMGIADLQGRILESNQALQTLLGYSADELRTMSVQEITHPEDWPETMELQQELLVEARWHYSLEKRYLRKDGSVVWAQVMVALLRDLQGEPQYMIAMIIDFSARKHTEMELRESEQRFRLMAETIQDVFWIAPPEIGKILYVSPGYEQVWGRSCQELYQFPQSFQDSIHPEDRDRIGTEIAAAKRQGIPCSHEYRIIQPDGAVRWINDRGYPIRDDQGRVILFTGVATDITERKALEAQLLQAQKMEAVGRLAGGVAHDFNNLLMAITGYGELMRSKVHKDDPLYGHLENILKAGDRAAALTRQLLTFSRQKIVHPQVIDLNRVILDLEPMLRRLIGEDLDLEVVTERGLGAVKADPGQMGQIIMNLVVNARDAMPRGGRLTLKTAPVEFKTSRHTRFGLAPPGAYVRLEVADTGFGMDEATQAHVFEPFFTTKDPGKGTGLGLSTVYGIVQQSGGYLDLATEPGAGSTFTVYLPRLEAMVAPPQAKIPITASCRGEETVLLVEDEDVLRGLLAKFLRLHGYTVLEARHGGEALLTCERHQGPIQVMVTDVVMPQMSGRELADRLTLLRPEMRILYMSGYTEDALVQHGVADLSADFLQKPFRPIELARRVYAVLHPPASQ